MSKRIGEIISKIYRHPTNNRQVIAISRAEAEKIPPLPGVAMISITSPERSPALLLESRFLLRVSFSDVDFLSGDLSVRGAGRVVNAMSKEQAAEIISFVKNLPNSLHTVLVHCEGGVSRSCGVSVALAALFAYEVEEKRLGNANQSVKRRLMEVAATMFGHDLHQ